MAKGATPVQKLSMALKAAGIAHRDYRAMKQGFGATAISVNPKAAERIRARRIELEAEGLGVVEPDANTVVVNWREQ